jgi:hypothetical protein
MVTKNKKLQTNLAEAAQQAGVALMTAAVTLGMVEVPEHEKRAVLPMQPAFAFVNPVEDGGQGTQLRRERDEVHPQHISYGINQRTPARSGKI